MAGYPRAHTFGAQFSSGWKLVINSYPIPPGYEAKLHPCALLSYKEKLFFTLHKRKSGFLNSVAFTQHSIQMSFKCEPFQSQPFMWEQYDTSKLPVCRWKDFLAIKTETLPKQMPTN